MASERRFGYRMYQTEEALTEAIETLYREEVLPCMERRQLSVAVYTQLSDVEDEINGLLTYDRRMCKVAEARLRAINRELRF